jgi:hypothetical protein
MVVQCGVVLVARQPVHKVGQQKKIERDGDTFF